MHTRAPIEKDNIMQCNEGGENILFVGGSSHPSSPKKENNSIQKMYLVLKIKEELNSIFTTQLSPEARQTGNC